jgi:hypothetical protein
MTPAQIMEGMAAKNRLLTQKNEEYLQLVEKRAQAERDYNIALTHKTIELKTEGNSITLISTLVKGDRTVADLKYKMDVAYGVEKACLESIKDIRTQVDTYRSLLTWLRAELQSQ